MDSFIIYIVVPICTILLWGIIKWLAEKGGWDIEDEQVALIFMILVLVFLGFLYMNSPIYFA